MLLFIAIRNVSLTGKLSTEFTLLFSRVLVFSTSRKDICHAYLIASDCSQWASLLEKWCTCINTSPKQSQSKPESSPAYETWPTERGQKMQVDPYPPMVSLYVVLVVTAEIPIVS